MGLQQAAKISGATPAICDQLHYRYNTASIHGREPARRLLQGRRNYRP